MPPPSSQDVLLDQASHEPQADLSTGVIESPPPIPLAEALARWRREARAGICNTGRYRCRYFVWGKGQPLLFIHGIADRARMSVPVMAHLADSFCCIGYELPDGVADGARLGRTGLAEMAADAAALLDVLQFPQASVYAASFGGTIALAALHSTPRRFFRAVLQSSFARRPLAPMERTLASLARYWPGRLGDLPLLDRVRRRADALGFVGAAPEIWAFQQANSATTPVRAFAHRALLIATMDLRPMLPSTPHPVMLLSGDRDSVIGQACGDELARGLPHADRLEFAGCGHYAQYTHAAAVAATLRRFLLPPCGLASDPCG
jgi:3-oxoadipate enol-lactonase